MVSALFVFLTVHQICMYALPLSERLSLWFYENFAQSGKEFLKLSGETMYTDTFLNFIGLFHFGFVCTAIPSMRHYGQNA